MINLSEDQIIELPNAKISVIDNDIFYVRFDVDKTLEIDDFKGPLDLFMEMSKSHTYKAIIELPMHTHASPEARKYVMETPIPTIAEAIVFKSLAQRIIIRFYLMVNKQTHPVRIFTEKDDAVLWLNSL